MARPHTPETRGTEIPLPGIWHWLVMIPITVFALLVCGAVLWIVVGQPVAGRLAPVAVSATTTPLAVTDTMARTGRLAGLMATKGST